MHEHTGILSGAVRTVAVTLVLLASYTDAQSKPYRPAPEKVAASTAFASEQELAGTQEQLLKLLRTSPTLTSVIERDPSLLSNQDYVSRNNPELALFLQSHPEIARNPDFYLFAGLNGEGRQSDYALQRKVWPEFSQPSPSNPGRDIFEHFLAPFLVFLCVVAALLWLIHTLLENRRWGRIFKMQMDAHGKLIDRFSTNQELLLYMNTEAGKRFLEAAPIPVNFEHEQRVPSAVARILYPLQIGVVLTVLGVGLLFLSHTRLLGVVVLMPGLGLILSAGITWVLAGRLGLMPSNKKAQNGPGTLSDLKERQ